MKMRIICIGIIILLNACSTTNFDYEQFNKNYLAELQRQHDLEEKYGRYGAMSDAIYATHLKNDPRIPINCQEEIYAFLDLWKYKNPRAKDWVINAYLCKYTYDPLQTDSFKDPRDNLQNDKSVILKLYGDEMKNSLEEFQKDVIDPLNKSLKNIKAPTYNRAVVLFKNATQYAYNKNYPTPFIIYLQRQEEEANRIYKWMVK